MFFQDLFKQLKKIKTLDNRTLGLSGWMSTVTETTTHQLSLFYQDIYDYMENVGEDYIIDCNKNCHFYANITICLINELLRKTDKFKMLKMVIDESIISSYNHTTIKGILRCNGNDVVSFSAISLGNLIKEIEQYISNIQ